MHCQQSAEVQEVHPDPAALDIGPAPSPPPQLEAVVVEAPHAEPEAVVEKRDLLLFRQEEFVLNEPLLKALKRKFRRRDGRKHRKPPPDEGEHGESPDVDEIMRVFERFDWLDFDVLRLSALTHGYPLIYVAYAFMVRRDLFKMCSISEAKFLADMTKLQSLYNNNNQFHNCTRAASILQALSVFVRKGLGEYVSEDDLVASVMSCSILYIDHPGLDNYFQGITESYVSTLYNGRSTTENCALHRWVRLYFGEEKENFLPGADKAHTRKTIREPVLGMVLATDIENYKELLVQFRTRVEYGSEFSSRWDKRLLMQAVMLLCSVDYCFRINLHYKKWIRQKLIQGYAQALILKNLRLPIQRMFDVSKKRLGGPQRRFVDHMKALVKAIMDVFPRMKKVVTHLRLNSEYWSKDYKEDFVDLEARSYEQSGLLEQQKKFVLLHEAIPVPEVQDKNVDIMDQKALIPAPTDDDRQVYKTSMEELKAYFALANKDDREPSKELAALYCVADVEANRDASVDVRVDSVKKMFDRIDEWNFDMFCLEKILNDDPLVLVSYVLFVKYDWLKMFKIQEETLLRFLRAVNAGYQRNPYHNSLHATDVMQIMNSICIKGGLIEKMSQVDLLAAIVSSLVHDLDHPGLNDAFQVHSDSYLARLYNDRSVLEAHHCSETFRLMREEGMDIFKNLPPESRRDCRKSIVEMIISTDMSNHAKYVKSFNRLIEAESDFSQKRDLLIALQIAMKIADVSNPSRPTYIYLQWTKLILNEFFRQGDKEKLLGLPVSPLMDRDRSVVSRGQNAFITYVLIPMFKSFAAMFPKMSFTLGNILGNSEYWKKNQIVDPKCLVPTMEEKVPVARLVEKDLF